jgi:hypothetical protein
VQAADFLIKEGRESCSRKELAKKEVQTLLDEAETLFSIDGRK